MILQFRIEPFLDGNVLHKAAPERLICLFLPGKAVGGFQIQPFCIREEEALACRVQKGLSASSVADQEIFLRETVGKMRAQEGKHMMAGADLRE